MRQKDRQRYSQLSPEQMEKRREAGRRYAEKKRLEKIKDRRCVVCDGPVPVEFIASRNTCSDECKKEQAWRHSLRYRRENRGQAPTDSTEAERRRSEARKRVWAEKRPTYDPRECRACGVEFVPAIHVQRFCSVDCRKDNDRARRYGVSPLELRAMLEAQDRSCAICHAKKKGWTSERRRASDSLVVDHCHNTNRVRGLLCGDCNTALGRFGDDPARLRAAADYLERC